MEKLNGSASEWHRVPSWDGVAETYAVYRFDQTLYVKRIRKADRYLCGPQLVRALGPQPRNVIETWDGLDDIDEVNEETGSCTGLEKMYAYLERQMNLTSVAEVGQMAEQFFKK